MSVSTEQPWSGDPNAPQIPFSLYIEEKEDFAGFLMGAISYGVAFALFFRCMSVLLSPVNSIRSGIKWALAVHTMAMFSFLTIPFGIDLIDSSICYVNNREFPGNDKYPPGPIGYWGTLNTKATATIFYVMFPLNQWLADGLLLHRCYIIYSMNYWIMALPCVVYFASVTTGIAYVYQASETRTTSVTWTHLGTLYFSIALSLPILLTLMIVMRLIAHRRDVRKFIGALDATSGPYTAIIRMVSDSYALYAITFLLYIMPWAIGSPVMNLFFDPLRAIQVIAPYLIILRVANRRALTSEKSSGASSSVRFKGQWTRSSEGSLPEGDSMNLTEVNGKSQGRLGAGADDATVEVPFSTDSVGNRPNL